MLASVRALLSGIVDYAGLFPPAQLPLDQAIRNYARYRTEPESWVLGRFICPAARLEELQSFLSELFQGGPPLTVSALGRSGSTVAEFMDGLRADVRNIVGTHERHGQQVKVEAYEVRLPAEVLGFQQPKPEEAVALAALHAETGKTFQGAGLENFGIFYELPFGSGWRESLENLAKGLFPPGGIKVRCGGPAAADAPEPAQIAAALIDCRDKEVPLKATAGLHHPIRHCDAGVKAPMHGFLNVFVAGVLTFANRLSEKEIQAIIEDEDPKSFTFDDDGLRWKTNRAKTAQIETARREFITSFGSCSFDEPRDGLRTLGLIP